MRFPITQAVGYSQSLMRGSGCTLSLSKQGEQSVLWSVYKPAATLVQRNTKRGWNTDWSCVSEQQVITVWTTSIPPLPQGVQEQIFVCVSACECRNLTWFPVFSFVYHSLSNCLCFSRAPIQYLHAYTCFTHAFPGFSVLLFLIREHLWGWLADQSMISRAQIVAAVVQK